MEKRKEPTNITIAMRPWLMCAVASGILLILSYWMASTMPDCHNCPTGTNSFIQFWHGSVSVLCLLAGVGMVITGIIVYSEDV